MTWVVVEDQNAPSRDGRTLAWNEGYPRYHIEVVSVGGQVGARFWMRPESTIRWQPNNVLPHTMVSHVLAVLGFGRRLSKRKSPFDGDGVQDPDEVRWAPEGTPIEYLRNELPFWPESEPPPTDQQLLAMILVGLEEGIPLGSYLHAGEPLPRGFRYPANLGEDWHPRDYRQAAETIGQGGRFIISQDEYLFRQRCGSWFTSQRITELVLEAIQRLRE